MKNQTEKKVFRSRISVLLLGIILAVFIPCTIPMIKHVLIPGLWIIGGTFVFIVFLFNGMRYIISEDKIYVKVWMFPSGSVEISNITSVERSYNPLSSPAASLKRLRINLRGKTKFPYMLISPVREQEFIKALKAVNPTIYIHVPDKIGIWRIQDWDI
jgi:Protein of unknown function (DUF1200).